MAVVQKNLYISNEIMEKVSNGEYKMYGGEVRNSQGQIVSILRPASKLETVLHYGWKYRKVIRTFGELGIIAIKSYINSKDEVKNDIALEFNEALAAYLSAVRTGPLTLGLITNMMELLEEMNRQTKLQGIKLALSVEDLNFLVNQLFEYTNNLAEDNDIHLTDTDKEKILQSSNPVINLQRQLETQKHIFELVS